MPSAQTPADAGPGSSQHYSPQSLFRYQQQIRARQHLLALLQNVWAGGVYPVLAELHGLLQPLGYLGSRSQLAADLRDLEAAGLCLLSDGPNPAPVQEPVVDPEVTADAAHVEPAADPASEPADVIADPVPATAPPTAADHAADGADAPAQVAGEHDQLDQAVVGDDQLAAATGEVAASTTNQGPDDNVDHTDDDTGITTTDTDEE